MSLFVALNHQNQRGELEDPEENFGVKPTDPPFDTFMFFLFGGRVDTDVFEQYLVVRRVFLSFQDSERKLKLKEHL